MRACRPITEEILDTVAEHVRQTDKDKGSCRYQQVPLLYVFGPERSHDMFVEVSIYRYTVCGTTTVT